MPKTTENCRVWLLTWIPVIEAIGFGICKGFDKFRIKNRSMIHFKTLNASEYHNCGCLQRYKIRTGKFFPSILSEVILLL